MRLQVPKITESLYNNVSEMSSSLFFSPVNYPVAVEEVHPGEYLPHDVLDAIMGQAGRRNPLDVEVQVLVHMLKHQEQVHLSAHLHPLAVANIKQSGNADFILFCFFFLNF